jgi:hypothetical protein
LFHTGKDETLFFVGKYGVGGMDTNEKAKKNASAKKKSGKAK